MWRVKRTTPPAAARLGLVRSRGRTAIRVMIIDMGEGKKAALVVRNGASRGFFQTSGCLLSHPEFLDGNMWMTPCVEGFETELN